MKRRNFIQTTARAEAVTLCPFGVASTVMNHGIRNGSEFTISNAWPTDLIVIECFLPKRKTNHIK